MPTHAKEQDIPTIDYDDPEERALEARLIAAGYRMPTKSLDRPRQAVKKRPWWKAFFVRLFRLNQ
ncbi:MAG TPA: hypothetical protein VF092_21725 [Longimicrobium sp.]